MKKNSNTLDSRDAVEKRIEHNKKNPSKGAPLEGGPANRDAARMLPHLRNRPFSERPAWVERRVLQLGEN